jgi:hypothetical protein
MAGLYNSSAGHSSLGYENPAFKIQIVNPNDDLQQSESPGRKNPNDDLLDNLVVGQRIVARIGKRKIIGKVTRVYRNAENDGIYVSLTTKDGKTYKVDGSRISTTAAGDSDDQVMKMDMEKPVSSPGLFAESKLLSFEQFVNESNK